MKKLSEVVNVVPVIAKSDSLTIEERDLFKVKVFQLPLWKYGWRLTCLAPDRSGMSSCTTISVSTPLTQMRMMTKRFS
jgi:hypothetical protein